MGLRVTALKYIPFFFMKCFEEALQRGLLFSCMDSWTNPLLGHSEDECSSGSSRLLTTEVLGLRVLSPAALAGSQKCICMSKIESKAQNRLLNILNAGLLLFRGCEWGSFEWKMSSNSHMKHVNTYNRIPSIY